MYNYTLHTCCSQCSDEGIDGVEPIDQPGCLPGRPQRGLVAGAVPAVHHVPGLTGQGDGGTTPGQGELDVLGHAAFDRYRVVIPDPRVDLVVALGRATGHVQLVQGGLQAVLLHAGADVTGEAAPRVVRGVRVSVAVPVATDPDRVAGVVADQLTDPGPPARVVPDLVVVIGHDVAALAT